MFQSKDASVQTDESSLCTVDSQELSSIDSRDSDAQAEQSIRCVYIWQFVKFVTQHQVSRGDKKQQLSIVAVGRGEKPCFEVSDMVRHKQDGSDSDDH